MSEPRRSVWPKVLVTVTVLLTLVVVYGAAYWWLMTPVTAVVRDGAVWVEGPHATFPREWVWHLFQPAHWIDCNLVRPHYWAWKPYP